MRASFSATAAGALLASGIADALSAGVLLFVCLVDLLPPMMTDSDWLRSQRWPMQARAGRRARGCMRSLSVHGVCAGLVHRLLQHPPAC